MTLNVSKHVSWGAKKVLNLVLEVVVMANAKWTYRMDGWIDP